MTIDYQGLLAVLKAAEEEGNFYMGNWKCSGPSGTTHCMIGAFCNANQRDKLRLDYGSSDNSFEAPIYNELYTMTTGWAISTRFGITALESRWLFTSLNKRWARDWRTATYSTKPQALARLRKFLYYKMHKQEMIIESGRNKQQVNLGRNIAGRSSAVLAGRS